MSLKSRSFNPSNVSITGGTITGVSGVPYTLAKGGIPLIGLSSGSVAANGAISGITALPAVYPDAYCYFPANALATVKAAGWYYCTFSTTTAGVAFLDAYTSGVPMIPSSPTAVTDGKGAFTGDTGEEFGHTITLPANTLGTSGVLRVMATLVQTNNANAKTGRLRWSTSAGTVFFAQTYASVTNAAFDAAIANTGATNKNVSMNYGPFVTTTGVVGTIDATASTTAVISIQRATATDNFVILPPTFEVMN